MGAAPSVQEEFAIQLAPSSTRPLQSLSSPSQRSSAVGYTRGFLSLQSRHASKPSPSSSTPRHGRVPVQSAPTQPRRLPMNRPLSRARSLASHVTISNTLSLAPPATFAFVKSTGVEPSYAVTMSE